MSKIYDALRKASGAAPDPVRTPEAIPEPDVPAVSDPAPRPIPPAREPGSDVSEALPALDDVFAKELGSLWANIDQIFGDRQPRVILVAGSIPGEGASTVSARFAQLLAEDPKLRVSLIDADFRNRDARPVALAEPGTGMASALTGRLSAADAMRPTVAGGLEVLPSEGVHANPYPICSADHVAPLLRFLKGRYHVSVVDAAPVLSAPESAVLAGQVDGTILVVRAGRTKRDVVKRALTQLEKYRARVLGVVMNRQQYVIPEFIYRRL